MTHTRNAMKLINDEETLVDTAGFSFIFICHINNGTG